MTFIFSCIYFYLPAALANMGAFLSKFVPGFKDIHYPVDFRLKIHNRRAVGDHKTIGGYLFGVVFGTSIGILKYLFIDPLVGDFILFDLTLLQTILLYFVMANGALLGDLLESIIKRLVNIPPHSAWVPFDEIDHSVFAMLLASAMVPITWGIYFTVVIAYFFLHVISNVVGYALKLKKVPY